MKKTHRVIDMTYHADEAGHDVMAGTVEECNTFIEEQDTYGYEVVPLLKEELKASNETELTPADFCIQPWGSMLQNSESETVAVNIMVILKRTGNTWRKLTWDEYKKERLKDGNFTENEKPCHDKVIAFCKSPDTAALFCPDWEKVVEA